MDNAGVTQPAEVIDLKSIKCEFESHLPHQLIERILAKSEIIEECLIWKGAITKSTGYGKIKFNFKAWDVHRLIGYFIFGLASKDDFVNHKNECTSKACIRPKHLYKGDRSQNMKDAYFKGTLNTLHRYRNNRPL